MSNIKVKSAYDLITGHKVLVDFMNKNVAQADRIFFDARFLKWWCAHFLFVFICHTPLNTKFFIPKSIVHK